MYMQQYYVYVKLACCKILGCLKININSTLDRYKVFRWRIYTTPGSELEPVLVLGAEVSKLDQYWFGPSV